MNEQLKTISRVKLNKSKEPCLRIDKTTYMAFRLSSIPKRFAMTDEEIDDISHIPGMIKEPIRQWINHKGFILIEKDLLNGRDTMFTNW